MSAPSATPLAAGREAARRREWASAFSLLSEADAASELGPEDLDLLGEAAITTGHYDDAQRVRERAFAGFKAQHDPQAAARIAIWLATENYIRGRPAVARGWHATAERMLADAQEGPSHGLLAWLRGQLAVVGEEDLEEASRLADEAIAIGRRLGDTDVEMVGLAMGGRALLLQGKADEGLKQMDTAMATALTGELSPYVARIVFCHVLCGCHQLGDYQRAGEWSDAAEQCCARDALVTSSGDCRIHKAALLRWRGAWEAAETEARRGSEELGGEALHSGLAFAELGEIRLRQGDLNGAAKAFRAAQECGHPAQPGQALLALAEGKTAAAASMIGAELEDASVPLTRAALLPAQVEIALAAKDVETARSAAEELARWADAYHTPVLEAARAAAEGAIALVADDPAAASAHLRRALRHWHKIGAPYEAARVRLLLGRMHLALGDSDSAASELKAARASFEELGALPDGRRAGQLLREIEAAGDIGPSLEQARQAFMFTDIVKSTSLIEAIGDEAWANLRRWHDVTLRALFAAHQGEEDNHTGDGFFVAFASSERALECALSIQRALAEHRRTHGFAPQVRIGVHVGEATRTEAGYAGRGVHLAARIGALAEGGEILASRETVPEHVGLAFEEPRTVELKGIAGPVEVVTIPWK